MAEVVDLRARANEWLERNRKGLSQALDGVGIADEARTDIAADAVLLFLDSAESAARAALRKQVELDDVFWTLLLLRCVKRCAAAHWARSVADGVAASIYQELVHFGLSLAQFQDAQDAVQHAMTQFLEGYCSPRDENALSAWFFKVVKHAIISVYRRGARELPLEPDWDKDEEERRFAFEPVEGDSVEEIALDLVWVESVSPMFARLSSGEWDTLQRVLAGYTQQEIGQLQGCTRGSVKTKFERAKDKLEQCLQISVAEPGRADDSK